MDYDLERAARWGAFFAATWDTSAPMSVNSTAIARDGSPDWNAAFIAWLDRERVRRNEARPDEVVRTMQVMRRLRRVAVREYEVLYRMLVQRETLEDTTAWLNERARSHGIPLPGGRDVHYRPKDTLALFVCGLEYALAHW